MRKQIYLGDEDFEESIKAWSRKGPDARDAGNVSGGVPDLSNFMVTSKTRDEAITKAYYSGYYTMKEIGEYFSLHYSTVSRIIKEYEKHL